MVTPGSATDLLRAELARHRVLAIVRGPDPDAAIRASLTMVEAGIRMVEVSLTSTGALDVIAALASKLPADVTLGAGTVLTGEQVDEVTRRGARFIVTPALAPSVGHALSLGIPVLAGAFSPSEVLAMHEAGAIVKLFPAREAGGARYVHALRGPFPDIAVVPVGGVGASEAAEMLRSGALAVGVGSPLLGDAAAGGDLAALGDRARRLLDAVAGADD